MNQKKLFLDHRYIAFKKLIKRTTVLMNFFIKFYKSLNFDLHFHF